MKRPVKTPKAPDPHLYEYLTKRRQEAITNIILLYMLIGLGAAFGIVVMLLVVGLSR